MGQLIASIVMTIVGVLYLFYSIRIADALIRINTALGSAFIETKPKRVKVQPSKFAYFFGRAIAITQASLLFGFGVRALIHNLFGI